MRVEVPDKRPAYVISQPALWIVRGAPAARRAAK